LQAKLFVRALAPGLFFCIAGCVQVPQRNGMAAMDINTLIKRIKCDLNQIVLEKAYKQFPHEVRPERRQPFLFLRSWAAKVRLSVAVDDTFMISPGASYTTPLHTVNNVAQSFTLGAGGSLSTQAVRQEDVEFLISFTDIDTENDNHELDTRLYDYCQQAPGLLLESDLGLDRLINAALMPVETGVLKPGRNFGPGASPPPAIPKADLPKIVAEKRKVDPAITISQISDQSPRLKDISSNFIKKFDIPSNLTTMTTKELTDELNKTDAQDREKAEKAAEIKTILENAAEATSIETKTQAIINNVVKPRYSVAQGALDTSCLKAVTETQLEAIAQSANVSAYVINIDKAAETVSNRSGTSSPTPADDAALKATAKQSSADLKKLIDGRDEVVKATNVMKTAMETCTKITKDLDDAKKNDGPTVYDPVSSITETINFYVTVTGGVTPTWKLVRVTAPTAATFLSGIRKDTNTLILTMGRPSPGTNGGPPDTRAMDAQILNSILGQSIIPRP
jgi:hypothetical protein